MKISTMSSSLALRDGAGEAKGRGGGGRDDVGLHLQAAHRDDLHLRPRGRGEQAISWLSILVLANA